MTQTNPIDDDQSQPLTCPKCNSAMEKVSIANYSIDRCTACKGLFFGAAAHEHLLTTMGAEVIDSGAPHREERESIVRINCPACHTQMIRMVDHRQPHIWFESCPVCFGVFMDAGEFREQKQHKALSILHDLFHHVERR